LALPQALLDLADHQIRRGLGGIWITFQHVLAGFCRQGNDDPRGRTPGFC
jgi:hypothetical protein